MNLVLLLSTFSTVGMVTLVEKASIVPTLLLLVGLFLVLGAMLRTASLIQYVSRTVVTGYIMAAASLIIVNQVQSLLGFQFGEGERAVSFFDVMRLTLEHLYKLPWESGVTYPLGLGGDIADLFIVSAA